MLAVVDLFKGAYAELGEDFELASTMDHEEIEAATGEGRLLVTDQAVNAADIQGGGSFAGFPGWYVDFSRAGVGSYRWTAPVRWSQRPGTAVIGEVSVGIDVTA